MQILVRSLLITFLLTGAVAEVSAQKASIKSQSTAQVWNVSPQVFKTKLGISKGLLLDVRTLDEFNKGHLSGATMIDYLNPDFEKRIKALDRNKPVFLYCASGGRSEEAAEAMKKAGFRQIYNLEGGYRDLIKVGMPSVQ
jgi:rhodanese-related sulfurtransferase